MSIGTNKRGNTLTKITRGQTLADFLLREKEITPARAAQTLSRLALDAGGHGQYHRGGCAESSTTR